MLFVLCWYNTTTRKKNKYFLLRMPFSCSFFLLCLDTLHSESIIVVVIMVCNTFMVQFYCFIIVCGRRRFVDGRVGDLLLFPTSSNIVLKIFIFVGFFMMVNYSAFVLPVRTIHPSGWHLVRNVATGSQINFICSKRNGRKTRHLINIIVHFSAFFFTSFVFSFYVKTDITLDECGCSFFSFIHWFIPFSFQWAYGIWW